MAITLTIAGDSKSYVGGTMRISRTANYHATATFSIRSNDASYRPAYDDEVIVSLDGTPILGGLIDSPSEIGVMGDSTGAYAAILTNVKLVDYTAYLSRRYVTVTLAAGTLKSQITSLMTYLSVWSITLSGSQPDGPSLPEVVCTDELLADVFNKLSTLTAKYGEQYVLTIDPSKVLLMDAPSNVPAPFDIPGAYGAVGDIKVTTNGDGYANRVIVTVPTKTEDAHSESFTGDGSTTTFALQYTLTKIRSVVTTGGIFETLNQTGDAQSADWTYNKTNNTIERNLGAPGVGVICSIIFDGTYTGRGDAQDASWTTNPRERLIKLPEAPSDTTVQAYAEGLLARFLSLGKTITYKTFGPGLLPGQSQHITYAGRNLDDDAIITGVIAQDYGERGRRFIYDVTAVTGTSIPEQFQDTYKLWSDASGGGGIETTSVGSAGPKMSGPGGPVGSVQFHDDDNNFGGHEYFTFDKASVSLAVGDLSSIDAALPDSCLALGYDCHVSD